MTQRYVKLLIGKNESIYSHFSTHHPALVKDEYFRPNEQAVIEIPQAAPEGSILRTEPPLALLERVKRFNLEWVRKGHRKGQNSHNVSCTISVKEDEWKQVGEWMWEVECPMDDPDSGWSEEDTLYFFPEDVVEVDKDGNPVTQ